jgi:2'-5' RNA ligase
MAPTGPASAVIVRLRLPPGLERIRRSHDPAASMGVPAHVTLLYPFLPMAQLAPEVRRSLAGIAGGTHSFDVRFARIASFPAAVYLAPDRPAPFVRLTALIAERFPGHPPYGGAFGAVVPHLTLATSEASLAPITATAERFLPFTRRASSIELLAQDDSGRWRLRWRIPLGVRR